MTAVEAASHPLTQDDLTSHAGAASGTRSAPSPSWWRRRAASWASACSDGTWPSPGLPAGPPSPLSTAACTARRACRSGGSTETPYAAPTTGGGGRADGRCIEIPSAPATPDTRPLLPAGLRCAAERYGMHLGPARRPVPDDDPGHAGDRRRRPCVSSPGSRTHGRPQRRGESRTSWTSPTSPGSTTEPSAAGTSRYPRRLPSPGSTVSCASISIPRRSTEQSDDGPGRGQRLPPADPPDRQHRLRDRRPARCATPPLDDGLAGRPRDQPDLLDRGPQRRPRRTRRAPPRIPARGVGGGRARRLQPGPP